MTSLRLFKTKPKDIATGYESVRVEDGWIIRKKGTLPDLVEKHYPGKHDQKSHGSWAGRSGGEFSGRPRTSSQINTDDGLKAHIQRRGNEQSGPFAYRDVPWAEVSDEQWANREQFLIEATSEADRNSKFTTRYVGTAADVEGLLELPTVDVPPEMERVSPIHYRVSTGEVDGLWSEYTGARFDGINSTFRKAATDGRRRFLPDTVSVRQADYYREVMGKGMMTTDTGFFVMRGVNQTDKPYGVGFEWTNPAFTSTTLSRSIAGGFASGSLQGGKPSTQRSRVFLINVPKGSKYMPIRPQAGEQEVVLPPDTQFKIVSHDRAYRQTGVQGFTAAGPTEVIEYEVYDLYGVEAVTPGNKRVSSGGTTTTGSSTPTPTPTPTGPAVSSVVQTITTYPWGSSLALVELEDGTETTMLIEGDST